MRFKSISENIYDWVNNWETTLLNLESECLNDRQNSQNRSIKQIVGHMLDSVSNNTHRVVHLQYQTSPLDFPNYATYGNNDRWIEIQNYQEEDWNILVQTWKYAHLHFCHVIENIHPDKLESEWLADKNKRISLKTMVVDFPRHFLLHISEIEELIAQQ